MKNVFRKSAVALSSLLLSSSLFGQQATDVNADPAPGECNYGWELAGREIFKGYGEGVGYTSSQGYNAALYNAYYALGSNASGFIESCKTAGGTRTGYGVYNDNGTLRYGEAGCVSDTEGWSCKEEITAEFWCCLSKTKK